MYFLSSQSVRRTFNTLGIAFCVSIVVLVIIGVIPFSVMRRSSAQQSRVIVSVATMPQAQLSG